MKGTERKMMKKKTNKKQVGDEGKEAEKNVFLFNYYERMLLNRFQRIWIFTIALYSMGNR